MDSRFAGGCASGRALPILVLSARGSEKDKVSALDLGADDYVTKPFGPDELLARVRACLRRAQGTSEEEAGTLVRSDLTIDFERHRVIRGEEEIRLTPKEFELLAFLARHPGKVLTHRTILKAVWGPHAVSEPQYLRVLMASLRKKIEPDPATSEVRYDRALGGLPVSRVLKSQMFAEAPSPSPRSRTRERSASCR